MIETPSKIYIDKSPIHGWGVFAKEFINTDEIIEICPIITLPIIKGESTSLLIDYRFNFPSGTPEWSEQVIALGYGSIYNHSDNPNANWYSNNIGRTFQFFAIKPIQPGDEILVYYGDENYWNDGRGNTSVI